MSETDSEMARRALSIAEVLAKAGPGAKAEARRMGAEGASVFWRQVARLDIPRGQEGRWLLFTRMVALMTPASRANSIHDGNRPLGAVLAEAKFSEQRFARLLAARAAARDEVLEGIGFLPRGPEAQIYSIENSDLSLVATAEITLGGSMKDEIVDIESLPLKFAGLSHCFRTEAGAHGKATRGIYRVHQFTKVEMFAFTAPDTNASDAMHEEIVSIEEEIFQGLGIPYRVIDTPTGDLGGPAYRKFDLEAWMPGRGDAGEYGEVTSASNCTDYQARRLGIRCKSKETKGTQFVHTLNGTAVAVTRAMIALLENNQQADGSVTVPEALRPWVGVDQIGPR